MAIEKRRSWGRIIQGTDQTINQQLDDLKELDSKEKKSRERIAIALHEARGGWVPDGKKIVDGQDKTLSIQKKRPLGKMEWVRQETLDAELDETGFFPSMHFRHGREDESESFMQMTGCADKRSYGIFTSIAFCGGEDLQTENASKRMFYAKLAKPLMEELKKRTDPDKDLENFSDNVAEIPYVARAGFFAKLGDNPKALTKYVGINHLDVDGLVDFYGRFGKNPGAFDGFVHK